MTAGLIVNPRSGKGSGRGLALARSLEACPKVKVAVLGEFGALRGTLESFAAAGVSTLFISSGDGTVQAIQTEIAERNPFPSLPRLALLPHGTTNLTAADLGLRNASVDRTTSFILDTGKDVVRQLERRPTLRVANPRDGRVRHGMFLGSGAIWQATVFCQQKIHATGLKGSWATFATLALGIGEELFSRRGGERSYPMCIAHDGRKLTEGNQLLFLATTLDKLILGTRPFWGGRSAPIRASVVAYPPPSIPRWLFPALYGNEDRRLPPEFRSVSAHELTISTACPFVIDGEFLDPPKDEPLRIETGPEFTYVTG